MSYKSSLATTKFGLTVMEKQSVERGLTDKTVRPPLVIGSYPSASVADVADMLGLTSRLPSQVVNNLHSTSNGTVQAPTQSHIDADPVLNAVALDVEYRLHQLIECAQQCQRHARRSKMMASDLQQALKILNVEPLYGFTDGVQGSLSYKKIQTAAGPIYAVEDEEIDLEKALTVPAPPAPAPLMLQSHWLAIEGVQPYVPQNPPPAELAAYAASGSHALNARASTAMVHDLQGFGTISTAAAEQQPLVKHVLSKELQLYFELITTSILRDEEDEVDMEAVDATRQSLSSDPGVYALVPYLIQFAGQGLQSHPTDAKHAQRMLYIIEAILANGNLFIEPYLHQLIPVILTALLSVQLPDTYATLQVRKLAASTLHALLVGYAGTYASLSPRIAKTLEVALAEPERSSSLGAILGCAACGKHVVKRVLFKRPILDHLAHQFDQYAQNTNMLERIEMDDRLPVDMLQSTLLHALHDVARSEAPQTEQDTDAVKAIIGPVWTDLALQIDPALLVTLTALL